MENTTDAVVEKSPAAKLMERVEEAIQKYHSGIALNLEKPDVAKYLTASEDYIRRMTPEDCSIAAITLTRYAMFVQKHYNAELAKVKWADQRIRAHIAPGVSQYSAPNAEERRAMAIDGDEFAKKLDQLRNLAQIIVDSLTNIGYQIGDMAKRFDNAAHSKRKI